MRVLRVGNYIITTPLYDVVTRLRMALTNGKLKEILSWHEGEDNIVCTCPSRHHKGGHERSAAMNIYVGGSSKIPYGLCKCWACDYKTDFVGFVAECFERSRDYAEHWLIENFGVYSRRAVDLGEEITIGRKKAFSGIDSSFLDQFQPWHPYLGERKLSREVCALFKIRYNPNTSEIIFPCFNTLGKIIMLPKRHIYYKRFYLDDSMEKPVYCLDYIKNNNIDTVIMSEGPFDVLTAYTYGFPAIGTFGNPSPEQIEAINNSCIKTIYLCFDNDEAGRRFSNVFKSSLSNRILIKEVTYPSGKKDLNDLSKDELTLMIKNAK